MSLRSLHVLVGTSALIALATPAVASPDPHGRSGGVVAPDSVEVGAAECATGQQWACVPGQRLVLRGEGLTAVERVEFLGRRGTRDDRIAAPVDQTAHELAVVVPRGARTGRLRATSSVARSALSARRVEIRPRPSAPKAPASPTTPADGVFPIAGRHDLGQSETNNFGGGRGHRGQDLFASCGTPLVSPVATTVKESRSDSTAGNYLVLADSGGRSYVFMHMRDAALPAKGSTLAAGQKVGYIGQSGNAQGCQVHFELWSAPGWYSGGSATDPLPTLKAWDSRHRHE